MITDVGRPRLIAVNRFYWPDHSATSQLLTDLSEQAAAEGMDVTVIASRLRYDDPKTRLPKVELRGGVSIRRIWTTRFGRSWWPARAIDYASFYVSATLALLALARRGDTILVKTDPPLLSVPLAPVARLKGARLVNWLQDLFPEVAGSLGMSWAAGPLGRLLRRWRDRSLHRAVNVAISEGMAARLRQDGRSEANIVVRHNWAEARIRPVARKDNPLRREWFSEERFVLAYSGNLGRAHAVSSICELVRRTGGIPNLTWLFVGGGHGINAVVRTARECGADVRFRPYQPRERLSESLSVGDLHLVSLDPACEDLIMPSKLYGIMAAGRGVIALGAPDGSVGREVEAGGFGLVLDIGRPENWAERVAAVSSREASDAFGRRARARYEERYLPERLKSEWLALLHPSGDVTNSEATTQGGSVAAAPLLTLDATAAGRG
jgi:colanic acid biosynthesis glycosyl transferase WcaI